MKRFVIFILTVFALIFPAVNYALDAVEFSGGYFSNDIDRHVEDYKCVPFLLGFDFDIKPAAERLGLKTKGRLDFVLEPFGTMVYEPERNSEAGVNFLVKYTFPLSDFIQPYLKGGVGAMYETQNAVELSTHFNFLPQAGVGAHFFVTKNAALSMEYRFRHASNAGIKEPNHGINSHMFLGGISYFFK